MMRAEFYIDLAEFDLAEKYTEDAYRRYMELAGRLMLKMPDIFSPAAILPEQVCGSTGNLL